MSSIYIAGKIDKAELAIGDLATELEGRGHTLPVKWWENSQLPTPYLDNIPTSQPAAQKMIDAAYNSDIFVLIPDEKILGAAVELGAALASAKLNPDKQIYVVNPYETRQSVFFAHESVVALTGLAELRQQPWY